MGPRAGQEGCGEISRSLGLNPRTVQLVVFPRKKSERHVTTTLTEHVINLSVGVLARVLHADQYNFLGDRTHL